MILRLWVAILVGWMFAGPAWAQPNTSYRFFQDLPADSLSRLHAKLTWGGVETVPSLTLYLCGAGTKPFLPLLAPYQDPRLSHSSDRNTPEVLMVGAIQFDTMLDSIALLETVTDSIPADTALYGFSLYHANGGDPRAFESLLSIPEAKQLLARVRGALAGDPTTSRFINEYVCRRHMLVPPVPVDLTDRVRIDYASRMRRDSTSGQFVGRMRITNTSGAAIPGPLYLLTPRHGVLVGIVRPSGHTCRIPKVGTDYLRLPPSQLAGGAELDVELRFVAPDVDTLRFRLFAGPGDL